MDIISAPILMLIISLVTLLLKVTFENNQKFLTFIPLIAGILGIILGILVFYLATTILPVDNVFNAIIMGLFSGMSAIGSVQMINDFKKLSETKQEVNNNNETNTKNN